MGPRKSIQCGKGDLGTGARGNLMTFNRTGPTIVVGSRVRTTHLRTLEGRDRR